MPSIFGFRDPVHHDPEEADAIRTAVADLLDNRTTLNAIAADWTRRGLRRRRGPDRPWSAALVFQVLTGDRLGGVVRRGGRIVDAPPTWLPIITRLQWDGLQVVLRDRDLRARVSYNRMHLARGIAHCYCGADLLHVGSGNRRRYICATRSTHYKRQRADDGLQHVQIADHLLDGLLRQAVLDLVTAHGTTTLMTYVPRSTSVLTKELGVLKAQIETLERSTDVEALPRLREARNEASLLEAERDDRALWEALSGLNTTSADTLAQSWDASPLEARHTVLRRTLIATVDLGRGSDRVHIQRLVDAA